MKKLVLFAAVILSMSAISCGNGEKGAATTDSAADSNKVDSTKKEVKGQVVDSAKIASVLDSAAVKA